MRSTTTNTHVSLTICAMSVLVTRGEHLRADLQAKSGVVEEQYFDSVSTKLEQHGGRTEDRPMLMNLAKPTVSGRKLLTSREVLTSSLYEPHSDGSKYLPEFRNDKISLIRIFHMHIPKTAGQSFDTDVKKLGAWGQWFKNATESNDAMKSEVHNFTTEDTRKPINVSHVSNQSEINSTIDDRNEQFAFATDLVLANQSEMNSTVDDEQVEVATDLFEALEEGVGLNSTSVDIAPVYSESRRVGLRYTVSTLSVSALRVSREVKMKMISDEGCLAPVLRKANTRESNFSRHDNNTFLVTLLREPVAHVHSMYSKCKANWLAEPIKRVERLSLRNISSWVAHYIHHPHPNFACYNPVNMQTRAFLCKRDLWHDREPGNANRTFELAKERMESFDFVGIAERFHESLCVFSAVVTSRAPAWCNCSNTEAWASFTGTHHRSGDYKKVTGVKGAADLSAQQRKAIEKLTYEDGKLYAFATQRFDAEVAKYEAKGILKLSC